MAEKYNKAIAAAHIPPEVMHRVVAMASGGMDTLRITERLLPYWRLRD